MLIWSDGYQIAKWSERGDSSQSIELEALPGSLSKIFKRPGKYRTLPLDRVEGTVAMFKIEKSDDPGRYPAQYVISGAYICKAFLKVLTGRTTIDKKMTVSVRVKFVGEINN